MKEKKINLSLNRNYYRWKPEIKKSLNLFQFFSLLNEPII